MELWHEVDRVTEAALASGALEPIATRRVDLTDGPITYQVRVLERLGVKLAAESDQRRRGANPFLPPDPELLVAEVPPAHVAVLNKFNVMDRHLLVVTRDFVSQDEPLDRVDWAAASWCLGQGEALLFYNGGAVAGASQPHRHLQAVPLPLGGGGPQPTPVEEVITAARGAVAGDLPYRHRLWRWHDRDDPWTRPQVLERAARGLMAELGIGPERPGYNLLLTRRWLLVVPRPVERVAGMSVNALGFAGSLLVPDLAGLDRLRVLGPGAALARVTGSPS